MNEFERKIREAMAVTRNNANPRLPTSGTVGKTTAEIAALSFGARALAASCGREAPAWRRPEHPAYEKPPPRKAPNPRTAIAGPMQRRPRAGCLAAPR